MENKFIRLLVKDSSVKIRIVLIIALVMMFLGLAKKEKALKTKLLQIDGQKQLVAMIPLMESKLKDQEQRLKESIEKAAAKEQNLILSGIFYVAKYPMAIVNGKVCKEKDTIGNFTVIKITMRTVLLQDNKNNRTVRLQL